MTTGSGEVSLGKDVMLEWVRIHDTALWGLGLLSLVTFLGTLGIIPLLVVRIPKDYFTREKRPPSRWSAYHPVVRLSVLIIKNVLGVLFILAGILMLFLPGQGILTMVVGITLINFPGKLILERWIIRKRPVHRSINWLRAKSHREPLLIPKGSRLKE